MIRTNKETVPIVRLGGEYASITTTAAVVGNLTIGDNDITFVQCGETGLAGEDGVGTISDVQDIVKETIHADEVNDGVVVDSTGNIRLSFGTLPELP